MVKKGREECRKEGKNEGRKGRRREGWREGRRRSRERRREQRREEKQFPKACLYILTFHLWHLVSCSIEKSSSLREFRKQIGL